MANSVTQPRIRQAEEKLGQLGYRRVGAHEYRAGGEFQVYHHPSGKYAALQVQPGGGFEIFVPVASTISIDATFEALEAYTNPE